MDEKTKALVINELKVHIHYQININKCVLEYHDGLFNKEMIYFNINDLESIGEFKEYCYNNFINMLLNDKELTDHIIEFYVECGVL